MKFTLSVLSILFLFACSSISNAGIKFDEAAGNVKSIAGCLKNNLYGNHGKNIMLHSGINKRHEHEF